MYFVLTCTRGCRPEDAIVFHVGLDAFFIYVYSFSFGAKGTFYSLGLPSEHERNLNQGLDGETYKRQPDIVKNNYYQFLPPCDLGLYRFVRTTRFLRVANHAPSTTRRSHDRCISAFPIPLAQ